MPFWQLPTLPALIVLLPTEIPILMKLLGKTSIFDECEYRVLAFNNSTMYWEVGKNLANNLGTDEQEMRMVNHFLSVHPTGSEQQTAWKTKHTKDLVCTIQPVANAPESAVRQGTEHILLRMLKNDSPQWRRYVQHQRLFDLGQLHDRTEHLVIVDDHPGRRVGTKLREKLYPTAKKKPSTFRLLQPSEQDESTDDKEKRPKLRLVHSRD